MRSDDNLHKYRDAFMRRLEMREQIGVPALDLVDGPEVKAMLTHYDKAMEKPFRDAGEKSVVVANAMRG